MTQGGGNGACPEIVYKLVPCKYKKALLLFDVVAFGDSRPLFPENNYFLDPSWCQMGTFVPPQSAQQDKKAELTPGLEPPPGD